MKSKTWGWILLGSAFLFLLVWEQVQSVRLGYEVEILRARAQGQDQKNAAAAHENVPFARVRATIRPPAAIATP